MSETLISEVKRLSGGKNITDSITIALNEWIALQKIKSVGETIRKKPIKFSAGFNATEIRNLSRKA